jgi:tetratricopeptide (TPR) repeat protein
LLAYCSKALITSGGRVKPTLPYSTPTLNSQKSAEQSELQKISKEDAGKWRALGHELINKASAMNAPEDKQEALVEALDAFRTVLSVEPNDPESLAAVGDIAFETQAFFQAANYYYKYLNERPTDMNYHKRYASALTFIGKADQSVSVLEKVLFEQPNDFQALAYLAIAESQLGHIERVKSIGEKALLAAPSEQERGRFAEFLNKIISNSKGSTITSQPVATITASANSSEKQDPFLMAIRNHPIAGSKIVSIERKEDTLILFFRDFPMQGMPTVARQKFLSNIAKYPGLEGIKTLQFMDTATNTLMEQYSLNR